MNNPYHQVPFNTGLSVNEMEDLVDQSGNISQFGKNKRRKLQKQLRAKLLASGGVPTTSGMGAVKMEPENNFDLPDVVELDHSTSVLLNEISENYDHTKYMGYNEALMDSTDYWHMVLIQHKRMHEKRDILDALFKVVGDVIFAPFGYRPRREVDFFLVHNQGKALQKLFMSCLKIKIKGAEVPLYVRLGVARFTKGHPNISDKLFACIQERMNSAALHGGLDVLDLTQLSQHEELNSIELRLSNKAILGLLTDQLNGVQRLKTDFHVFKLANNGIRTLEKFINLYGFSINVIDLRHNQIVDVVEFFSLKHLEIEEIYLAGNEVATYGNYRDKIFDIMHSLKIVDGQSKIAPETAAKLEAFKKSVASVAKSNSLGNNPILKIDDGIFFQGGNRKNQELSHILHSFPSYKREVDSHWTEVHIYHQNISFEDIMDELMSSIFNHSQIFPCYCKRIGQKDEFFLYKNFEALRSIMSTFLQYKMPPRDENILFTLRMKASPFTDGQVSWHHKIIHVLSKRIVMNAHGNILNLNDFTNDPEFSCMLVQMNSKANVQFILEQSRKQTNSLVRINAQNNGITTIEGFQILQSDQFSKVSVLDLRNNKISSLEGMNVTPMVKELMLDGNPICEKFSSPHEYVTEVTRHFMYLEYLDGHKIEKTQKIVTLQNFIVNRNAYVFADEFVKTYFSIYDSEERRRLMETYDTNSILTISCHFDPSGFLASAPNDLHQRVQRYATLSRSINKVANMNQIYNSVFIGLGSIEKVFNMLPKTHHVFTTFSIDVPMYEPKNRVLITVSGTFDDIGLQLNELAFLFAFTRTFILQTSVNDPSIFKVTNDQLSIHCPTHEQVEESKLGRKGAVKENFIEKNCRDLMPTAIEEKELKLILYKELTQQKTECCIKHLDESFWDVKVALVIFNTLMDGGQIPNSNFD